MDQDHGARECGDPPQAGEKHTFYLPFPHFKAYSNPEWGHSLPRKDHMMGGGYTVLYELSYIYGDPNVVPTVMCSLDLTSFL